MTTTTMQPGDVVIVESGRYRGCPLTLAGRADGWFVCLNSNEVGGYVRVRKVRFERAGLTVAERAERCDAVFVRHYENQLKFAQEVTGAR